MSRPLRVEYPDAWYHVINRGRRKEEIFFEDTDFTYFLGLLDACTKLFALEVHAYALLPNHYHLLVCTPNGNLSRIMRHLNGLYTQHINRKYRYEGSLFRGRFKAMLIEKEPYLLELVRYIHRNPLEARRIKKLDECAWTSHRAYIGIEERPRWLIVNEVLRRFGRNEKEAVKEFSLFVQKVPPRALSERLAQEAVPSVLGGDDFKKYVQKMLSEKKTDFTEVPSYKKECVTQITAKELMKAVGEHYGIEREKLSQKRTRTYGMIKRAYICVCRELLQRGSREIGNALGGVSRAMITKQYRAGICDREMNIGCAKDWRKITRIAKKAQRA